MDIAATELAPKEREFEITMRLTETQVNYLLCTVMAIDWSVQNDDLERFFSQFHNNLSKVTVNSFGDANSIDLIQRWS